MKHLILIVALIIQVSCQGQTKLDKPILIQTEGCSSCEICVTIDPSFEPDEEENKFLSIYLYNALIGGFKCDESLLKESNYYTASSFKKAILLFFDEQDYGRSVSVLGNIEHVKENKDELVYRIANVDVLHDIANELLQSGNTIGLDALWQNGDLEKLPNYQSYLSSIDGANFFVYSDQIAFLHNIGETELKEELMEKIEKIEGFDSQLESLKELLEMEKFDLATYKEAVYGGF